MIVNRQRRVRVPVSALNEFLAKACKALRVSSEAVTVCLVSNSEMARWNRRYRGKNRPTDVLSFPVDAKPGRVKSQEYLGDIAIAPAVARQNAKRFCRSLSDEMRILILHGILHLMGYDHETDTGQMERREKRLRRTFGLDHNGLVNDKGLD